MAREAAAATAAAPQDGGFRRSASQEEKRAANIRGGFKKPSTFVLIFGNVLAFSAGMINATAIRALKFMVTNMTGNTSNIALHLEGTFFSELSTISDFYKAIGIVCSFIFGAFLCGVLIDKTHVHLSGSSLYGLALFGNCVLLATAAFVDEYYAAFFAATASGLQNAMCTSHFGAIVRTTHVTGTVTDIGSSLGRMAMLWGRKRCRGRRLKSVDHAKMSLDSRKLLVLVPIYFSFMIGVFVGGFIENRYELGAKAFLVPAALNGTLGLLYRLSYSAVKAQLKKLKDKGAEDVHIEGSEDDSNGESIDTEDDETASDEEEEPEGGARGIRRAN